MILLQQVFSRLNYFDSPGEQSREINGTLIIGGTIVFMLLLLGVIALWVGYSDHKQARKSLFKFAAKIPLFWFVLVTLVAILGVNIFLSNPDLEDPDEMVRMGIVRDLPELSVKGYEKLTEAFPDSLELHIKRIQTHFQCTPEWRSRGGLNVKRQDFKLLDFYSELIFSEKRSDLGNFCTGLIHYFFGNYDEALYRLGRVNDFKMKYLHFVEGKVRLAQGKFQEADSLFRLEIKLGGNTNGSYAELAGSYRRQNDIASLGKLMEDSAAVNALSSEMLRYISIHTNQPLKYFKAVLKEVTSGFNLSGIIAALLILLLWANYLQRIDLFTPENWLLVGLVIVLGAWFALLALPLYDFAEHFLGLSQDGNFLNDLVYCIFGIGMIEELVKIIPLILIMFFTRWVKEPVDIIIFAALSALGFATLENLLYFTPEVKNGIYHGRALVSVTGHMCYSSVIAYAFILAKYKFKLPAIVFFFPALFAAASLHGMFDWFLFRSSTSFTLPLALGIHLLSLMLLGFFINNALNQSPFLKEKAGVETSRLAQFLAGGLMLVLVFEFVTFAFSYGALWADYNFMLSVFTGSYSVAFAAINLSNIDVMQGEWLRFRARFTEFRKNYNKAVGLRIRLRPIAGSEKLLLPGGLVTGKILQRVKLNRDNRYYLVQLEQPVVFFNRAWEYILIRPKSSQQIIEPGASLLVYFIVALDPKLIFEKEKDRAFFRFIDWAICEVPAETIVRKKLN